MTDRAASLIKRKKLPSEAEYSTNNDIDENFTTNCKNEPGSFKISMKTAILLLLLIVVCALVPAFMILGNNLIITFTYSNYKFS